MGTGPDDAVKREDGKMDREKVIRDAEEAIEILSNVDEPTPWCDFVRVSFERVLELLKEQEPVKPRLLAAEEVQHLPDKTVICVEQLFSREDEERGYITGMAWGIVCNRTNAPDGGLILSMLGTFFPNTVREIPYKATYRDENTKKRRTAVYRFWTDRPTDEQSKVVKWDA